MSFPPPEFYVLTSFSDLRSPGAPAPGLLVYYP